MPSTASTESRREVGLLGCLAHRAYRDGLDGFGIIISAPSLPGVHAHESRLSAKASKVEGCAWLDAHQSPDRSHSQRISNRGDSYFTFSTAAPCERTGLRRQREHRLGGALAPAVTARSRRQVAQWWLARQVSSGRVCFIKMVR